MLKSFKTLAELNNKFRDNQVALDHFKSIRWRDGEFCPHCGHDKVYGLKRKGIYRCAQCRKNFSILVGTIFENSKLKLRVWFGAIWLLTNHPKGIASTTLARDLGITQKSAWFVLHRLRHAARTRTFNMPPLSGTVEVDETYVGGKGYNRHKSQRRKKKGRAGVANKTPVIGAVERDGSVAAQVLPDGFGTEPAKEFIRAVAPNAERLITDAHPAYQAMYGVPPHEIINHHAGEYVRGDVHTNTIESVWALLKRQIVGTHHWVSQKHLQQYVSEMAWRMNRRPMTAEQRVNALFSAVEGRLTYKALIGAPA
jgi:transposase-like protein